MSAAKAALKRPLAAAFDGALGGHGQRIVALHLRAFEVKEEGGRRGEVAENSSSRRRKHANSGCELGVKN